jgi:D-alanyl-D-alanine carboxypeptidase
VKRRHETLVCFCAIVLAFSSFAAKKHSYKTVRPMEVPDGLSSDVKKAEPAGPPPPGSVSKIAPSTRAASVMVIDAHTGEIFYEKNADAPRPAASTQKLLTALIVAEQGYLDRPVTVQAGDTMAEPVKLNIRPGETYTRIELLRALLVKSPNDVARCLARDSAGSIEAFAFLMNEKARQLGATHSHFHHSFDRLSAEPRLPLRKRPDARIRKHEQSPEAAFLLQRNEDRLHRGGRPLPDRQRRAARARHHCGCARRQ